MRHEGSGSLCGLLGIRLPLIQAPMAGGPTVPALVAAVSEAGGLGSFGAAYMTPAAIREACAAVRERTDAPFGINLFAGGIERKRSVDPGAMLAVVTEAHAALGLPPPALPEFQPDPFPEQLEAVLEARPAVFSFTFGLPAKSDLKRFRDAGIVVMGTATSVAEARALEAAGCHAVVAQGSEAGGHRGTFLHPFEEAMTGLAALLPRVVDAVAVPVVASGGIMDGRGIRAAAALGAAGVQLGTAFLACPESGAAPAFKQAILAAAGGGPDATAVTRAFSGRPARGLVNGFLREVSARAAPPLPYPQQNALTRPMRTEAARQGRADYLSLWAGQAVALARPLPAADLVRRLAEEAGWRLEPSARE